MRMLRIAVVGALLCGSVALASGAEAASSLCGTTITVSMKLHHDVHCPSSDGIRLGANNITLNLNGHTIVGPHPDALSTVGVRTDGFTGLTIKKGHITGFRFGIELVGSSDDTVTGLHMLNNGHAINLCGTQNSTVSGNTITHKGPHGGDNGILLNSCSAVAAEINQIVHNKIRGGGSSGIRLNGAIDNTVEFNSISRTAKDGIHILNAAASNTVEHNSSSRNGIDGIAVEDASTNTISFNSVSRNHGNGIEVVVVSTSNANNVLEGDHSSRNTLNGIRVGPTVTGTIVSTATANKNHEVGIDIETTNTSTKVQASTANFNSSDGMVASNMSQDGGGNSARGNHGSEQCSVIVCS